jgi:hypothetical protein
MAIDTREKWQAVAVFGTPWLAPGTTPNASKDQEWRQESLFSYPGILADNPVASTHIRALVNGPIIMSKFEGLIQ